ncbi:hypothetical protein M407DRAFT_245923 [Tulasnella calospora MUT 4182]|uniref:Uncharacterized protein n=1 Tax=Tulasnella calospora MUT 4182 TaxID=1051891 RepID=A0A0C3Q7R6_9AGAM|nr:hypothetical protein M407DRAFT_245923 [Tulasnella calospora MUT 4182]
MSPALDASFNPFALHPFTSGGSSAPQPIPRPPVTSSPLQQAIQYQKQNPMASNYTAHPQRRGDPSTPPGGYAPPPPSSYAIPSQQQQPQGIFTPYVADGRRTPDLDDILVKKGGSRWPVNQPRK